MNLLPGMGKIKKQMEGLDVLPFNEFYKKVFGKEPSGPLWDAYMAGVLLSNSMLRQVIMPPGVPREAVAAVREAIGPDIGLMVDANQQMSVKQAIRIGRMMEELNLTWFEEPIICHDHEGEAEIRAALPPRHRPVPPRPARAGCDRPRSSHGLPSPCPARRHAWTAAGGHGCATR